MSSAWRTAEEGDIEDDIDTLLDEQNVYGSFISS
jgi:hypothetical protein